MKKFLLLVCLFACAQTSLAAWGVDQLMQDLALRKSGRAHFVEKKYISLLDKPVISSGELSFTAPDRLEKRTLQPKPERVVLDKDKLEVEYGGKKYSLRLATQPEALAFADSIRGTLTGNRQVLEASYALQLSGTPDNWSLRLLPSDTRIAALVSRIDVKGSRNRVTALEYLLADGDRTVMSIDPIDTE